MMNKYKKTTCPARKAMNADGSRFLSPGALKEFLSKKILLIGLAAVLISAVPFEAEARFLFFGRKKTDKEIEVEENVRKIRKGKPSEKSRAVETLRHLDEKKAAEEAKAALPAEKDGRAKRSMINALGNSGDKSAIPVIKENLTDVDGEVRLYAACALAQLGDDGGLAELEKVVLNPEEGRGSRSFAIRALSGIKSDEAVAVLEKVLGDDDFAIRLQATSSLGRIGTERAIGLVKKMLSDPDERVAQAAENALRRL